MKAPRRVHLQKLAEQDDLASQAELLNQPKMPPAMAYIWAWWRELDQTRGAGGMSVAPLTRHDIHAWEHDEGQSLEPWERRLIIRLDAAWRASLQEPTNE